MANLESQSSNQLESQMPILSDEERQTIWCSINKLVVYEQRRDANQVGTSLSDFHKQELLENCGEIDFDMWVTHDEANRDANHRAMERMKAKNPLPGE